MGCGASGEEKGTAKDDKAKGAAAASPRAAAARVEPAAGSTADAAGVGSTAHTSDAPPPAAADTPPEKRETPPVAAAAVVAAPPPQAEAAPQEPPAAADANDGGGGAAVAACATPDAKPAPVDEEEEAEFDEAAFQKQLDLDAHECLDLEFALEQVGDDAEFLVELKDSIQELMEKTSADFEAALADGNWQSISEKAHALKGATSNLGMNRIRTIALGIELSGRIFHLAGQGQAKVSEAPYTKAQARRLIELLEAEWAMFGREFEERVVNGVAKEQAEA